MRYLHMVRLIDAKLERLEKARQILSSTHLLPLPNSEEVRTVSARSRSPRKSKESASRSAEPVLPLVELRQAATPINSAPPEAASLDPMIVSASEPLEKAPEAAPPSPARVRSRRERTPSVQRLLPALQRALGGAIPDAPVFVSSKKIETERIVREAATPVDVPMGLTAELLSQRWLGSRAS